MDHVSAMSGRDDRDLARRNLRLALIHGLIALGFLALFFWTMSHK